MFYFARCINIIFNSLLVQLVKYDFHTTRKIKFMPAIIYHILFSSSSSSYYYYTLYVLLLYTVFPCSFFNAVKCVGLTSEVVVEPPLHLLLFQTAHDTKCQH